MKNTIIKKAIACMTSLMAVSALSVSMASYAANTPTINTSPANKLSEAKREVGIPINKDIVLFNVDESQILSPNITYSYKVTEADIDATTPAKITTYAPGDLEADGKTPKEGAVATVVTVKKGVIGAISTVGDDSSTTTEREATISFGAANDNKGNDNVTKHATNKESAEIIDLTKKVRNSMTITVDANKIYDPEYGTTGHTNTQVNGPGVYRYKIEDVTTPETLAASGIDRKYKDTTDNHDKYVYLDVYTKYNEQKNGLVVYGYVLLKDAQGNDNVDVTYDHTETGETLKVTGFDTESENTNTYSDQNFNKADLTSDAYHTYNVKIEKAVAGDLGDTANEFPFQIELSDGKANADFYWTQSGDADTTPGILGSNGALVLGSANPTTNPDTSTVTPPSSDINLKHGESCTITGLPTGTKVKVSEYNNTGDTYTVDVEKNGDTTNKLISGAKMAKGVTASMSSATDVNRTDQGDVIKFTNTLKDISVTGLLFNIAPFIFITAAGVVLITLFMRNKKKDNFDNMI